MLHVFREVDGKAQLVGTLSQTGSTKRAAPFSAAGRIVFSYDPAYLSSSHARSLSGSLPLRSGTQPAEATRAFFEGLLPEGSTRRLLDRAIRGEGDAYGELLRRLNNESVGALLFNDAACIDESARGYEPVPRDDLSEYARHPEQTAMELDMRSRLSLAGAQTKVGLYHCDDDVKTGWFIPRGGAPSTHIVKIQTPGGLFPHETVNEALCMETARRCGFEAADCQLVPVEGQAPLLAVRRFDRVFAADGGFVDGMPVPRRLHQEDFCQASGTPAGLKYEPTDGHYLARCADVISRCSANPFGDRMMLLDEILFDVLIGNCDNHLKNYSLVWDAGWTRRELSPVYDVTCTTMYPQIYREMGVSLCASRRIDDVTGSDIRAAGRTVGVSERTAWAHWAELCAGFSDALSSAEECIAGQGFDQVREVAEFIRTDAAGRMRRIEDSQ